MEKFIDIPDEVDKIEIRKSINKLKSLARNQAKGKVCLICGKEQTSFCNSHSVPQMVLHSISEDGKILQPSLLMGMDADIIDGKKGIGNSGTFHCICKDCDGKFFQDYENHIHLIDSPNDMIMAEIAVKNILLKLDSIKTDLEIRGIEHEELSKKFENADIEVYIKKIDLDDYTNELLFHKQIVEKNITDRYQVLFWKVLPYTVPIAMQSVFPVTKDIEGNIINDIFDMSRCNRLQYLHMAVFPFQDKSIVLAFFHKRDRKYKNLRKQFFTISEDDALKYINFFVFKYTDNYYISPKIEKDVCSNKFLLKLSREKDGYPSLGIMGPHNNYGAGYKPVSSDDIPNFLSREWAI